MTKDDLSEYCKKNSGLDAATISKLAEVPRRTFYDWWKTRRRAVELIIKGIASENKK